MLPSEKVVAFTFSGLLDPPGGGSFSWAWGISANGSVVVGFSDSTSGFEAFYWTESTDEMVGLGHLLGGDHPTSFPPAFPVMDWLRWARPSPVEQDIGRLFDGPRMAVWLR